MSVTIKDMWQKAFLWLTIYCFAFNTSAFAESAFPSGHLKAYAERFNALSGDLDHFRQALEIYYPRKADRAYLQSVYKKASDDLKPLGRPQLSVKGSQFRFDWPDHHRITMAYVSKGTVRVNGQEFHVDLNQPLQETHQRLAQLIERSWRTGHHARYELFLPEAHAIVPFLIAGVLIAAAIIYALPPLLYQAAVDGPKAAAEDALQACENRDHKVPYEKSEFFAKLQNLKNLSIFTLDSQRTIKDCDAWALDNYKSAQADADDLRMMCKLGDRLLKCNDAYQSESSGNTSPATEAPTSM